MKEARWHREGLHVHVSAAEKGRPSAEIARTNIELEPASEKRNIGFRQAAAASIMRSGAGSAWSGSCCYESHFKHTDRSGNGNHTCPIFR